MMFVQNQRVAALINATLSLSVHFNLSQTFKEYGNETMLAKSLIHLFSVHFPGNVQSQQIWGFPGYETGSAGLQCAAGEACVYLGVVCVCWEESNHCMMRKGCHTPLEWLAGVIETERAHTHTQTHPLPAEEKKDRVCFHTRSEAELNFYSTINLFFSYTVCL